MGRILFTLSDVPKAFWELPPLEREEHLVKVRCSLQPRLNQTDTARCIRFVHAFETLDPKALQGQGACRLSV